MMNSITRKFRTVIHVWIISLIFCSWFLSGWSLANRDVTFHDNSEKIKNLHCDNLTPAPTADSPLDEIAKGEKKQSGDVHQQLTASLPPSDNSQFRAYVINEHSPRIVTIQPILIRNGAIASTPDRVCALLGRQFTLVGARPSGTS
ncbi:MAG: hypothetical protein SGI97_06720 [candidate division Zixibacteria bacterium]|nr:hypothetical protein [candidate division Zixibacteria bacterium]